LLLLPSYHNSISFDEEKSRKILQVVIISGGGVSKCALDRGFCKGWLGEFCAKIS
jgi:hypothetical protein